MLEAEKRREVIRNNPTRLFHGSAGPEREKTVLSGLRDAGTGTALVPVLREIDRRGFGLDIFADSHAAQTVFAAGFREDRSTQSNLAIMRVGEQKPDVIFTGFSLTDTQTGGSGIELMLTAYGNEQKIPVIWLVDSPSGGTMKKYRERHISKVLPDYLCVANDIAKEHELQFAPPGFDSEKIIVTGQPALDTLFEENTQAVREHTRQELGVAADERLLVYMGSPLPEISAASLEVFLQGLSAMSLENYKLVVRRHPSDITHPAVYSALTENFSTITADRLTTDAVGAAADLIVTVDSTEGPKAAMRDIPTVHILVKDILDRRQDVYDGDLYIPMVDDGTSSVISSQSKAADVLYDVFFNKTYQVNQSALRKRWQVEDGNATQRVLTVVTDLTQISAIDPRHEHFGYQGE